MADEVKNVQVKVDPSADLTKANEKLYKKPAKEDTKEVVVNGKTKVLATKTFSTGAKNKGVKKRYLVKISKKGKQIG